MDYLFELCKLLQIPQLGAQRVGKLLASCDFNEFCKYDKEQLHHIGWSTKQIQRWFNPDINWINSAFDWRSKSNEHHIISLFDANYPFLLKQISTAPPILFIKGNPDSLSLPQIAMVGSRDYSHYGKYWSRYFADELVKHNLAVTSGLAIGIDGFCHKQAIESNGVTIAVLGNGLANVYPSRHKKLAEEIVNNGGALVSEFFPTQPPIAENFPRRNRIISGLSLGTLVIEATVNSGSLITAKYALEQGREVFALPNSIQNPFSAGCHKLIKDGALLVESIDDILSSIPYLQGTFSTQFQQADLFSINTPTQVMVSTEKFANIESELTACQQDLLKHITLSPISIDDIAKATQLSTENILIELLNLELQGIIQQVTGGYVKS
ncbi:DNA-processing protein DprA [Otariodibacter oris]|uniref:DNA processing protein n=1 Tax=Otariodibacter oris TaxID=1032623 RepID=A0A420XFX0_9PAST|nr:DNA-processing protein DprA [Otariodibacter oris]RKR71251.1 DNA processing protein [Otariodibacter oris]